MSELESILISTGKCRRYLLLNAHAGARPRRPEVPCPVSVPETAASGPHSNSLNMKLGMIGLGRMGAGMARNLLRAGHQVTAYNRTREKAEALSKDGVRIASSPADAARGTDAVVTMLSDDHALSEVV